MALTTWQGTNREYLRLQRAVTGNCDCLGGMLGMPAHVCAAHALLTDQSALDHLLYVYRMRKVFMDHEFRSKRADR